MPIRVEHQPSPGMVGLAAYNAGASGGSGGVGSRGRGRGSKYPILPGQGMQNRLALQGQGFDYRNQLADEQEERQMWHTPPALTPIPDYVDPATRKELMQTDSAIRGLSTDFSHRDANARARRKELVAQREARVRSIPVPSNAEAIRRDLYYGDEKTGEVFDEPGEGRKAYRKSTGKPAFDDTSAREEARQRQAEAAKASAAYEAERKRYQTEFAKHVSDALAGVDPESPGYDKAIAKAKKAAKSIMDASGFAAPTKPVVAGAVPEDVQPDIVVAPGMTAQPIPIPQAAGGMVTPAQPAGPGAPADNPQTQVILDSDRQRYENTMRQGPGVVSPATGQATPEAASALRNPNAGMIPIPLAPAGGGGGAPVAAAPDTGWTPIGTGTLVPTGDEAMTPAQRVQANAAHRAADRRARSGLVHSGPGGAGGRPVPLARGGFTPQRPAGRGTADFIAANVERNPDADQPLAVNPLAMADLSGLSPDELRRVRKLAESPGMREKLERQYGGSIQTIDEIYPDLKRPEVAAPRSAAREHADAIRGPQGTGEGIASDADRMANSIAGVRNPYSRPDTGGTVTKYRLAGGGGIDEDRFAAAKRNLDERMRLASQERLGEANAPAYRAQVDRVFGTGQQAEGQATGGVTQTASDPLHRWMAGAGGAVHNAGDLTSVPRRIAFVQGATLPSGEGVPLGSHTAKAIELARAGDPGAQRELDNRRIKWRL